MQWSVLFCPFLPIIWLPTQLSYDQITICSNSQNSLIWYSTVVEGQTTAIKGLSRNSYSECHWVEILVWVSFGNFYILIEIELLLCDMHLIKMYYNCWSILLKRFSFSSNRFARWQKLWFLCCRKVLRAKYRGWGQPWTSTPTPGMTAFFPKLSCSRLKTGFLPNTQGQDK